MKVSEFNRKTQRDISFFKQLYNDNKNGTSSESVWQVYDSFQTEYNKLISKCTDDIDSEHEPLALIVAHSMKIAKSDKDWRGRSKQNKIPEVLAGIFAWWSMSFFEKLRTRNQHIFLIP